MIRYYNNVGDHKTSTPNSLKVIITAPSSDEDQGRHLGLQLTTHVQRFVLQILAGFANAHRQVFHGWGESIIHTYDTRGTDPCHAGGERYT